jgi:hypothetical protein
MYRTHGNLKSAINASERTLLLISVISLVLTVTRLLHDLQIPDLDTRNGKVRDLEFHTDRGALIQFLYAVSYTPALRTIPNTWQAEVSPHEIISTTP